jgi:RNA polymerase sigma-70 factor (ECF subfamily)
MADSLEHGLALIDEIESRGQLEGYHLVAAAHADLLRRLGRLRDAAREYERALSQVTNVAERAFLEAQLRATQPDQK